MRVGFLTDTHFGLSENGEMSETLEVVNEIADTFHEENVDAVVHLGDVVDDRADGSYEQLLHDLLEPFEDFDTLYVTPGNHDAVVLEMQAFESYETPNQVLHESDEECTLFLDTAMNARHENCGYLSQAAKSLLKKKLGQGFDVRIISHYPLAYTSVGSEVFDIVPERAFPINKIDVYELDEEHEGSVTELICGHLHPGQTEVGTGVPIGCTMRVVEPVKAFDISSGELEHLVNTDIDASGLIIEL